MPPTRLKALGIAHEAKIVSAHRTPERLDFATSAAEEGFKVIIAGAGGAAHLPGMTASLTTLPVLGVPVESQALKGQDSLYSIVQMPAGVPVGTLAIGKAGRDQCRTACRPDPGARRSGSGRAAGQMARRPDGLRCGSSEGRGLMRLERPLPPGSTIGILGGGQLGRMLSLAAAGLASNATFLRPRPTIPAYPGGAATPSRAYDDEAALARFAGGIDVVTYEFENVPAETAAFLDRLVPLAPGAKALEIAPGPA